MTVATPSPRTEVMPPIPMGEGFHDHAPLSFAERAAELTIMVNEGHVPTIAELLEMQHLSSGIGQRPVFDYERSEAPIRTDYFGPDGERISADVALGLLSASMPTRWAQTPDNERLLSEAATMLRSSAEAPEPKTKAQRKQQQKEDAHFATIAPAVNKLVEPYAPLREATSQEKVRMTDTNPNERVMVSDTDGVGADTLERLVTLSRFSRKELANRGVDIDALLQRKSRIVAAAPAARVIKDPEQSIRPTGRNLRDVARATGRLLYRTFFYVDEALPPATARGESDDTVLMPQGPARARATVFDRKSGKAVRAEGLKMSTDDAEVLAQLLRDTRVTSDQQILASALYPEKIAAGRRTTNKPLIPWGKRDAFTGDKPRRERRAYLKPNKGGWKNLSPEEQRRVESFKRQLGAVEGFEAKLLKGGEVPDRQAVLSALFPGLEGPVSPQQTQAVDTAMAKLNYVAYQAAGGVKIERFPTFTGQRLAAERLFRETGQNAAALAEKLGPQMAIASRRIGAAALSLLVVAAFLPMKSGAPAEPVAKVPVSVTGHRGY